MKTTIIFLCALILSISSQAVTITDNFNNGISSLWDVFDSSSIGIPWTVDTLSGEGRLVVSKSSDNHYLETERYICAGLRSKYQLIGDFSASVDFELINFPAGDFYSNNTAKGWNWASLKISTTPSPNMFQDNNFSVVRVSPDVKNGLGGAEGWAFIETMSPPFYNVGLVRDETMIGKFGITRQGNTISAWLDRGFGLELLGSFSSPYLVAPVYIHLAVAQVPYNADRPHTALDVRFDNFTVTADSIIIPEPTTLSLLALGAFLAGRKRRAK